MKLMLAGILTLGTCSAFAQNLTKAQLAGLFQTKKAVLETVSVGMSKIIVTNASVVLEDGTKCDYRQTAVQSILRIEGERLIILSKESFQPAVSEACQAAGFQSFQEDIVFFESKPSVERDIQELNESDVRTISRAGEVVTLTVNGTTTNEDGTTASELMTVKYDLSKSSFKNMILSQSPSFKIETLEAAPVDISTVDLRDVVFCENNDGDNSECVRGDFSDILF